MIRSAPELVVLWLFLLWLGFGWALLGAWALAVHIAGRRARRRRRAELPLDVWALGVLEHLGAPVTSENLAQVIAWARAERRPSWLEELELEGVAWPPPGCDR